MTRQGSIERLRVSLAKVISEWMGDGTGDEEDAWGEMGYLPDDIHRLMSQAAISVLESSANAQGWMREQGYLKD